MKIQKYNSQVVPEAKPSSVRSLGAERKSPVQVVGLKTAIDETAIWDSITKGTDKVTDIGNKIQDSIMVSEYNDGVLAASQAYSELLNDVKTNPEWQDFTPDEADEKVNEE